MAATTVQILAAYTDPFGMMQIEGLINGHQVTTRIPRAVYDAQPNLIAKRQLVGRALRDEKLALDNLMEPGLGGVITVP